MAAENKRMGGKGMSGGMAPNLGLAGAVTLEAALSGAIGARIRITTAPPASSTLEGTLFTACPVTNLIAINTSPLPPTPISAGIPALAQPSDFHILPISRIQNFQLLSLAPSPSPSSSTPSSSPATPAAIENNNNNHNNNTNNTPFANAYPAIYPLDIRALKSREAAAVARLQEREMHRGKGVSKEAQDLFDAFSRTMPTRWDGTSIIVADTVIITKPYHVDNCQAINSEDGVGIGLTRVRKVLEMERKKIELRNASAAIANSTNFPPHPPSTSHHHNNNNVHNNNNNNSNSNSNLTPPTTHGNSTPRDRDRDARVAVPIPNHAIRSPPPSGAAAGTQRKGG
ncbi:hypothetical protein AJ80_04106 [Polytolypa hystricis UAMH7299]|uniref:AD domain-containing protein n=1 Tax=Polytolypa hystricis (strain UAMH7299) TaxID=1447883 RepID=A0A2B7YDV9_POLH7|nr:hypothetical protein AJ80_04106 [Polytolypa hystricis UAMH7299]